MPRRPSLLSCWWLLLVAAGVASAARCDTTATNMTVGGALSISAAGRYFSTGRNIYQALLMFQDWVNDEYGGVYYGGESHCLHILIEDDESSIANVKNITTELLESKAVDFLLAPYSSDLTKAAASIADSFNVIMLSPGSASSSVFEEGAKTVGYFYEDQTYTTEVCGAIPDIISSLALDLTIVHATKVPATASADDINAVLDQYEPGSAPDIFIGCTYFEECITSLNLMSSREFEPGAKIFTLCATDASFQSQAGSPGLYTLTGAQWDPSLPYLDEYTNWTAQEFATLYEDQWGEVPAYQGAAAFAIMEALLKAVESANSLDTFPVAYYLSKHIISSFYGELEFDSINMNNAMLSYVQAFEDLETAVVLPESVASRSLAYPIDCIMLHGAGSCMCTPTGCTYCTADDYDVAYDSCDSSLWQTVHVTLKQEAQCVEQNPQTGTLKVTCPYTPFMSSAGWAIVSLFIATMLSSIAGIVWLFRYRQEKIIIASQPTFLALFCGGVAVLGVCILSVLGSLTPGKCIMRVWTGGIGFTVAFGSLTLKVFRVYRIFGNATLTRVRVRERDVLKGLVGMILFDVVVLTFLSTMEPPSISVHTHYEHHDIVAVEDHSCNYGNRISITIFIASKAILMLHGLYLSFKTRHVDSRFESSGKVMLAIYQYALAFVTFALIDHVAALSRWETNIVFAAALTFAALSSMVLIILSKVIMLHENAGSKDSLPPAPMNTTSSRASSRFTGRPLSGIGGGGDTVTTNPMFAGQAGDSGRLTHRQFMDIVFSPADIIDMNERIAFLETENYNLAKQVEALSSAQATVGRPSTLGRSSTGRLSFLSSSYGSQQSYKSQRGPTPDSAILSQL